MSQPTPFRFAMKQDATTWYAWEDGAGLITDAQPRYIKDPIGWDKTDMRWVRSDSYLGLFRSVAAPFEFVLDGAKILRTLFYNGTVETKCYFVIERCDPNTYQYEPFFAGEIDFSTITDRINTITAALHEGGLAGKLKAEENTPYEIPLLDVDTVQVRYDGLRLRNSTIVSLSNDIAQSADAHQLMPNIRIQSSESQVQVDVIERSMLVAGTSTIIQDNPFFQASIDGTVRVDWNISVNVGDTSAHSNLAAHGYKMVLVRFNGATNASAVFDLFFEPNVINYFGTQTAVGSVNIPMIAGEVLAYFSGLFSFNLSSGTDAFLINQTYNFSTIEVHYDLILPTTTARQYRYYQALYKLSDLVTGTSNSAVSNYLSSPSSINIDCRPYHCTLTSGDELRGLRFAADGVTPIAPALRLTFADLWKDATSRWMLGLAIRNGQIIVEPLAQFFDASTIIADLGDVVDFAMEPANDFYYNAAQWGYANQEYDTLNGRDEPNTTHFYKYPTTQQKQQEMISGFRWDMYGHEYTRANLIGKKTTDAKSDNDTFGVEIESTLTSGAYKLYRPQNSGGNSATGLIAADRAFNLTVTPKRNFLRNGPFVHSFLYRMDSQFVTFQTTDKNAELISNLGWGTVTEKADEAIADLGPILFKPYQFLVTARTPLNMSGLMAANPDGCFQFTYKGMQLKGFPMQVGIAGARENTYQMRLLCTPDTDISLLQV